MTRLSRAEAAARIPTDFLRIQDIVDIDTTGATDCSAALTEAINTAISEGRCLEFSGGTFRVDEQIVINIPTGSKGFSMRGQGAGLSRLLVNNIIGGIRFNSQSVSYVNVEDMGFVPNIADAGIALRFNVDTLQPGEFALSASIRDCRFSQDSSTGSNFFAEGIRFTNINQGLIKDCLFNGVAQANPVDFTAISMDGISNDCHISDVYISNARNGIYITSGTSEGLVVDRATMVRVTYGDRRILDSQVPLHIIKNSHINATRRAIYWVNATQGWIQNNLLYLREDSVEGAFEDIQVEGSTVTNITRNHMGGGTGSSVPDSAKRGIVLIGGNDFLRVEDNSVSFRENAVFLQEDAADGCNTCAFRNNLAYNMTGDKYKYTGSTHINNRYEEPSNEFQARVFKDTGNQSIPASTDTTILLNNLQNVTPNFGLAVTGSVGEYSVLVPGTTKMRFKVRTRFVDVVAGKSVQVWLERNGSVVASGSQGSGPPNDIHFITDDITVENGDIIRLRCRHTDTTNRTINANSVYTFLVAQIV